MSLPFQPEGRHDRVPRRRLWNQSRWLLRRESRSLQRHVHSIPRIIRFTFALALGTLAVVAVWQYVDYQNSTAIKMQPTDFSELARHDSHFWSPPHVLRRRDGVYIGDRYTYLRPLGEGHEGVTAIYNDTSDGQKVVIKVFTNTPRNPLPERLSWEFADYTAQWPAEIEAGLLLQDTRVGDEIAYVPVKDYFILRTAEGDGHAHWNWAMVSPALEAGTLVHLAVASESDLSTRTLDARYRPHLHRLLHTLHLLHTADFCHDDVKPDNVFISASEGAPWLLGDLGNVRHASHPWHATQRWRRENQWADCRLNDVRRALKTYLTFLRKASVSSGEFDQEFVTKETGWSRLYWEFEEAPRNAGEVLRRSMMERLEAEKDEIEKAGEVEQNLTTRSAYVLDDPDCLARKVDLELTCTSVRGRAWDFFLVRWC